MSQELGEAMQIARVAIDGVPMVIKGSSKAIQDLIKFIFWCYKNTKGRNKEKIKELMAQPGEKCFAAIDDEKFKEITKALDKMGVKYVQVPDFNESDGKSSIMFNSNDWQIVERVLEGKYEMYKNFEEYHKVYGDNWSQEMEELFREKGDLPTVAVASIVNEKGNITPEELKEELSKIGKFTDEQINLAIEDAIKDDLIKTDNVGNYGEVENFNDTLSKHYEKTSLMRGRAFVADDRFESVLITEDMKLSDEEVSEWLLPEDDKESGLLLNYYILPNTKGSQIVGVPKEHTCGTIYPGTNKQANQVFISKSNKYKVYDITDKKNKKIKYLEEKRGSQLRDKYFTRRVEEGSGVAKEKEKTRNNNRNNNRKNKDGR